MCAGAIYWSGIRRVVYGFPGDALREIAGPTTLALPCREVFARGTREIEVHGPLEMDLARTVHEGFYGPQVSE